MNGAPSFQSTTAGNGRGPRLTAITVLVVEDNPIETHLLKSILLKAADDTISSGAISVLCVGTLAAAGDSVAGEIIDVVILDLTLPDSSGLETLRKFREYSRTLPIVILTGTDDEALALQAVQAGAQDYLIKGQSSGRDVVRAVRYAVERHRLHTNVLLTDELTGLYNRRGFLTLAQQHLHTIARTNEESLLVFADMDGLKAINDRYGHHEGSNALVRIAAVLKKTFRNSDIVARIGGDEFAVIAMHARIQDIEAIKSRLEQILLTMNDTAQTYTLSLSIGAVSMIADGNKSMDELLADADAEMYREKQRKRY